jgi:5-methylcytosine-specific restriction endonuclease McrBC regulatory subunit McrC
VQILLNKKNKLARKKNKVYGILFDVSWLWEQYLAIQLKASGFSHSDNRKGTGSISVLKNNIGRFIPDFYKAGFVIDAKYKQFDKSNPPADDLAQVIAYMHVLSIQNGGYMYPSKEQPSAATKLLGEIKGYGGTLYLFPVYIPQKCESFSEFVQAMEKQPAQDII